MTQGLPEIYWTRVKNEAEISYLSTNLRLLSAREDQLHSESQLQSISFNSDHDSRHEIKYHLKKYLDSYRQSAHFWYKDR